VTRGWVFLIPIPSPNPECPNPRKADRLGMGRHYSAHTVLFRLSRERDPCSQTFANAGPR